MVGVGAGARAAAQHVPQAEQVADEHQRRTGHMKPVGGSLSGSGAGVVQQRVSTEAQGKHHQTPHEQVAH